MSSMEAAARMGSRRSHRRHAAHRLKSTRQQMLPLLRAQEHLNVTKCLLGSFQKLKMGLSSSGQSRTHTLVFTLAPDSSSPYAEQPPGHTLVGPGLPGILGPPMLNLTAWCTLLSCFCSANCLSYAFPISISPF